MTRKFTDFEIRMKDYEKLYTSTKCMSQLPTFCRIDGKAFHTWTSDLKRPYDERLSKLFVSTTKFLLEETGARIGYTQSDEITLCWYFEDYKSEMFFNGKCHKLNSVIASLATGFFNKYVYDSQIRLVQTKNGVIDRPLAFFDCRTWQVPNLDEAANVFLWREQDATRNSISMAAQSLYSHKELHGKNTKEMQEMIFAKGINWNDYPTFFKKGTYLTRNISKTRDNCALFDRSCPLDSCNNVDICGQYRPKENVKELKIPPFKSIVNRVEVLFKGEAPIEKAYDQYITAKSYVVDGEVVESEENK